MLILPQNCNAFVVLVVVLLIPQLQCSPVEESETENPGPRTSTYLAWVDNITKGNTNVTGINCTNTYKSCTKACKIPNGRRTTTVTPEAKESHLVDAKTCTSECNHSLRNCISSKRRCKYLYERCVKECKRDSTDVVVVTTTSAPITLKSVPVCKDNCRFALQMCRVYAECNRKVCQVHRANCQEKCQQQVDSSKSNSANKTSYVACLKRCYGYMKQCKDGGQSPLEFEVSSSTNILGLQFDKLLSLISNTNLKIKMNGTLEYLSRLIFG